MAVYSTKTNRNKSRSNTLKLGWSLIGVFSVLLLIVSFNFLNIMSIVITGSFGLLFYPLCLFFIIIGIMKVINKPIRVTKTIVILTIVWVCIFVLIMQMLTSKNIELGFSEYIRTTFKENLTAGGVIFGTLLYPLYYLTHEVATYIILSCALVIVTAFLIDRIRLLIIAKNTFKVEDANASQNIETDNIEEDDEIALESNYVPPKQSELIDDDVFITDDEEDEDEVKVIAKRKLGLSNERTIDDLQSIASNSVQNEERQFESDIPSIHTAMSNMDRVETGKPNIIVHEEEVDFNINKFVKSNSTSDKLEKEKLEKQKKEDERKRAALEFLNISKGKFQSKELEKGIDNVKDDRVVPSKPKSQPTFVGSNPTTTQPSSNEFIKPQNTTTTSTPTNPNIPRTVAENGFTKINITEQLKSTTTESDLNDVNLATNTFGNTQSDGNNTISIPEHLRSRTGLTPSKAKEEYSGQVKGNMVEPTKNGHVQMSIEDPMINKGTPRPKQPKPYIKPPINLLTKYKSDVEVDYDELNVNAENIVTTLKNFKIDTKVLNIVQGPTFTQYEMQMLPGIPVNSIYSKQKDLEMALTNKIRLQIPIPGKNAFGIEVANGKRSMVGLRDIIESEEFQSSKSPLTIALGKDIYNNSKVAQIDKMVHGLVAGATGSGKSVCLHTMLISLLYKAAPDEVRILLVDPKMVEFPLYNDLPHMLIPKAITDVNKAIQSLEWLVAEMERRYTRLMNAGVRNIISYNESHEVKSGALPKMYYIVMVFDEVGDFMSQRKKDIEENCQRLAAKARACGIHLILTTQRPTTDIITGNIKSNLPSRIAFAVNSFIDSKTILDAAGAEALLGKGDMLFSPQGQSPERMQCAFVDDNDLKEILKFVKNNNDTDFDESIEDEMFNKKEGFDPTNGVEDASDPLLKDCLKQFIKTKRVASGALQGWFGIGYPRANKIVIQMEKKGYVSSPDSKSRRQLFITEQEFEEIFGESIDD